MFSGVPDVSVFAVENNSAFFSKCFLHHFAYRLNSVSLLRSIDVLRSLSRIPSEEKKKTSSGNSEEAEDLSFSTGFLVCQCAF